MASAVLGIFVRALRGTVRRSSPTAPRGSELAAISFPPRPSPPGRIPWARLLARIYEVLPLLCPACQGEMRVIAFLTDPPVRDILRHLGIQDRPPPLTLACAPPQAEIEFDQTPALDPTLAAPGPELDLDQSLPDEWEN